MTQSKFTELLKSRKFWASLIGLLAVFGVTAFGDVESEKLIEAIMVIVSVFVGGTALEDGLRR